MKIIVGVLIAIVVIVVLGAAYSYFTLGPKMESDNIEDEVTLDGCEVIDGVVGPEDFEYIEAANGLVIAGLDRRADEDEVGKLHWMDLSTESPVIEGLDADYPDNFRPHGITSVLDEEGEGGALYVISHPETDDEDHTIEIFALSLSAGAPDIQYVGSLEDNLLSSPNDLVALSNGDLVIANDGMGQFGGIPMMMVDMLMHSGRAQLVYYDGEEFSDLNEKFISSAGITAFEDDGTEYIYRPDVWGKIHQYELEYDDDADDDEANVPKLDRVETWDIEAGPDNLQVSPEGDVYVTGHHSFRLLMDHEEDEDEESPTLVFKLGDDGEDDFKTIYANEGGEFSAGSVATVIGNYLFVGQIFGDGILVCPLEE